QKGFMYVWMFSTMTTDDIKSVLGRLAADSHMHDTIDTMPSMKDFLLKRGVPLEDYKDPPESLKKYMVSGGRGTEKFFLNLFDPKLPDDLAQEDLPEPYKTMYMESSKRDLDALFTVGNAVRGSLSQATMGLTEVPVGLYGSVKSVVESPTGSEATE